MHIFIKNDRHFHSYLTTCDEVFTMYYDTVNSSIFFSYQFSRIFFFKKNWSTKKLNVHSKWLQMKHSKTRIIAHDFTYLWNCEFHNMDAQEYWWNGSTKFSRNDQINTINVDCLFIIHHNALRYKEQSLNKDDSVWIFTGNFSILFHKSYTEKVRILVLSIFWFNIYSALTKHLGAY